MLGSSTDLPAMVLHNDNGRSRDAVLVEKWDKRRGLGGCDNDSSNADDALANARLAKELHLTPELTRQMTLELAAEMGVSEELARQVTRDIGPPPDGGLVAWLNIIAAMFTLFTIFGIITSFGTFQRYYLAHQLSSYSKSTVAWLGSVQSTCTYFGSVFSGRYFDNHGPRLLAVVGTVFAIGSLVSLAFCHEYYQFLLAHILYGIAGTLVYSPATAIAAHWFLRRRSTAVGVIVGGAGLGGVIYPVMLKSLFDRLSFRNAMLVLAGVNSVLMLPCCTIMRARLPPRAPPPWSALKRPWKEVRYTFLVLGAAAFTMNVFSPYYNAPSLGESNNVSPNIVAYSVAILQAGSFFGRVIAGVAADQFGVWNVFGTTTFACALFLFAFWTGAPSTPVVIIGWISYGMASGAWFTLVAAATAAISPARELGMRLGMLWTSVALPPLVGPVIAGALIGVANGKFVYAGIYCGFTMLLSGFLLIAPRVAEIVRAWCGAGSREKR